MRSAPYKGRHSLPTPERDRKALLKFLRLRTRTPQERASRACRWAAARAGSNFNPKGKSVREIMRFLPVLHDPSFTANIGADVLDVPAGDIGVGGREIGYMFGQYKRINQPLHRGAHLARGWNGAVSLIPHRERRLWARSIPLAKHAGRPKGEELGPARPPSSPVPGNVATPCGGKDRPAGRQGC